MDLISSFKPMFRMCQIFGIAPYTFEKYNRLNKQIESPGGVFYTQIVIIVFVVMAVIFFRSNPENYAQLFQKPAATAKFFFLMIFTTNAFVVYVTVSRNKKLICDCNNFINERCSGETFRRLVTFNRNILLWYSSLHFISNSFSLYLNFRNIIELRMKVVLELFFLLVWSIPEDFFMCLIMSFMNLARFKFRKINRGLIREIDSVSGVMVLRWLRSEDMLVKDYVNSVGGLFQYSLFLQMFQLFLAWISLSFEMIMVDKNKFHIYLFIFYILARLIPIFTVFECTKREAEKTANHVHELFLDYEDLEFKEEIEIFSLQLQHRKVEFSACGFFPLDFTLLYSMVGAVTTYIIILMQFQKEDPTSLEENVQKTLNCSILFHYYTAPDVYRCLNTSEVLA